MCSILFKSRRHYVQNGHMKASLKIELRQLIKIAKTFYCTFECNPNVRHQNLTMHKVYMHVGAIRQLLYGCVYVREIIHSLKLVNYLPGHTYKPYNNLHLSHDVASGCDITP